MNPDLIIAIGFAVLFIALVVYCIKDSRPKCSAMPDDLAAKPVDDDGEIQRKQFSKMLADLKKSESEDATQIPTATYSEAADTPDGEPKIMTIPEAIEAGAIRQQQEASSHLGYDAPEIPCPAIQEAQKRLSDLPQACEVKRKANIGDWIKVTNLDAFDDMNKAGSIMQVIGYRSFLTVCSPDLPGLRDEEFEVLTGIPPATVDKPSVVAVTKPKPYRQYDADRVMQAMQRAANVALELRAHMEPKDVSDRYGYASPESMRKALNRYGYRLNGQPKEAKQDAAV